MKRSATQEGTPGWLWDGCDCAARFAIMSGVESFCDTLEINKRFRFLDLQNQCQSEMFS